MNAEELKQLKPGDDIFIRAKFKKVLDYGDVNFTHTCTNLDDDVVKTTECTHRNNVIIPPSAPKYDPCRRFKKGDKVRVVAWNGRRPITIDKDFEEGERPPFTPECVVIEDEDASTIGTVKIQADDGGQTGHIIPCFLELVTPIEELEPYRVEETTDYFSVDKDDEEICLYWKDKHPNPKAAAEAERDRLNAEHRKEQA